MNTPQTLRELFEAVVALPEAERSPYLDAHCADADLRARVEQLLAADGEGDVPLLDATIGRLVVAIGGDDPETEHVLPPGSRIGAFELLGVIGEGGSSTVFRAQRVFEGGVQEVAIKLLRQSLFSPEAQRRFRHEQRALIQLQHPHIARMIEGGVTPAGLPYLALEFVDGLPITEHAREQGLDLRARLRLFVDVCAAVDAAHRALIVHRDLKPSNVLVDRSGEVKLLDFGIAKLLTEEDDGGRTLLPAFTPAYAAPEQRSGDAITTATDVYALGILLGELLTGERFNDGSGRTPSGQVGTTTDPGVLPAPPPVTRRQLRGDLDAIVLKAVEADPGRRYTSAGALADDIERVLDGRPVSAHAPSRWYRARKFVTRHRGAVASTLAFLIAILAALGLAIWQARVAHLEAVRANEQTRHATAIRDFLVSVFESAQSELPREKRPTVEELVDDASVRALNDQSMSDRMRIDLLLTLAEVDQHVGAYDQALALLGRIAPDIDRLYGELSTPWMHERRLRAGILLEQAHPQQSRELLEPLRATFAASGSEADVDALVILANAMFGENHADEAQPVYAQARALAAALPEHADEAVRRVDIARVESLVYSQKFAEGLALADATLAGWRNQHAAPSRDVLNLLSKISVAAEFTGDMKRAEAAYRDAIDMAEQVYVRPHPDTAWVIGLYGSFLVAGGRYDEAEPYILRALAMRRALLGSAHPDTLNAIAALGRLRAGQMRRKEARAAFTEGVALCTSAQVRHNVCPRLLGSLAQSLLADGEVDEAEQMATRAVEMQRDLTGADSPQTMATLGFLARVQVRRKDYSKALQTTDELLRIAERVGNSDSKDARYARFQRALALFGLDRNAEALALATEVVASQKDKTPGETTTLFSMLLLQSRALSRAGRYAEASSAAKEALAIERKPQPLDASILAGLKRLAERGRGY